MEECIILWNEYIFRNTSNKNDLRAIVESKILQWLFLYLGVKGVE